MTGIEISRRHAMALPLALGVSHFLPQGLQAAAFAANLGQLSLDGVVDRLLPAVLIEGEPRETIALEALMQQANVPGVSIAFARGSEVEWTVGFGQSEVAGARVNQDTAFQAGSISKPVAAAVAMILAERGVFDIDQDIEQYLKTWKVPGREHSRGFSISIRRLLSHVAGINLHGFWGYAAGDPIPTNMEILDGRHPANSEAVRMTSAPDETWRYSGGGYQMVQQAIEDMTGEPFPHLAAQLVLEPLGMSRSTFSQPAPMEIRANWANGHDMEGAIRKSGPQVHPEHASAGLWSTPTDLVRFAIGIQSSLAGQANAIMKPESAADMVALGGLGNWAVGFQVGGKAESPYFRHSGGTLGYRCLLVAYRGGGAIAIMTNGDEGDRINDAVLRTVAQQQEWPDFAPRTRSRIVLSEGQIDRLTGTYQLNSGSRVTFTRDDNNVMAILPNSAPSIVEAGGEDLLFWREVDIEATFNFEKPGAAAASFDLSTGGRTLRAVRISE